MGLLLPSTPLFKQLELFCNAVGGIDSYFYYPSLEVCKQRVMAKWSGSAVPTPTSMDRRTSENLQP